jgi:hypothetical protein
MKLTKKEKKKKKTTTQKRKKNIIAWLKEITPTRARGLPVP